MNTTLLLGVALLVGAPIKDPQKKEEALLVGEWFAESSTFGGSETPSPKESTKFNFTNDGKLLVTENMKTEEAAYKSDFTKSPAEIDLIPPTDRKKTVIYAIYKIEGNKLTVCSTFNSNIRPTTFESTPDNKQMVRTFRRAKKD